MAWYGSSGMNIMAIYFPCFCIFELISADIFFNNLTIKEKGDRILDMRFLPTHLINTEEEGDFIKIKICILFLFHDSSIIMLWVPIRSRV